MNPKPGTLQSLLEYPYIRTILRDNTPEDMLILLVEIVVLCIGVHVLGSYLQHKVERFAARNCRFIAASEEKATGQSPTPAAESACMDIALFRRVFKKFRHLLYLCVLYWGVSMLTLPRSCAHAFSLVFNVLCIILGTQFVASLVPFVFDLYTRRQGATLNTSHSKAVLPIIQGLVWALGITFLLDNLGFQVSTIIAGLGIVGVAVGLAGQAILGDFFSYLVILLDKPFLIGDFVEIGDGKAGAVEYMGLKTVHLRSLTDDLIVCANSVMTKGVITNLGPIRERQVLVEIGVSYDTPLETLRDMPKILQEIVDSFPQCIFNRACLLQFGDSNVNYQLMYFVKEQKGGIRAFMNTRSDVNVKILERFGELNIDMAYPTRQVYLTENTDSGDASQNADASSAANAAQPAGDGAPQASASPAPGDETSGTAPATAAATAVAAAAAETAAPAPEEEKAARTVPATPSVASSSATKKEKVVRALGHMLHTPYSSSEPEDAEVKEHAPVSARHAAAAQEAPRGEEGHLTGIFSSLKHLFNHNETTKQSAPGNAPRSGGDDGDKA